MEQQVLRGQVIHVNEDGWVVINRGAQDGVSEGLRFAVLGERKPRQIRDFFSAPEATDQPAHPVVLRADTAYELLRVILVERRCCIAISDRVPPERTPQPFLGLQGELLLYTPPPADWRYDAFDLEEGGEDTDASAASDTEESGTGDQEEDASSSAAHEMGEEVAQVDPAKAASAADLAGQQERLWDGALPLNAVQVGDEVILARPYHPGASHAPEGSASASDLLDATTRPSSYDWLKL